MAAALGSLASAFQQPCHSASTSRAHLRGPENAATNRCLLCPQAKYLAQIIVMGAQVVGRAFARALRQEFAGKLGFLSPWAGKSCLGEIFPEVVGLSLTLGHLLMQGPLVGWVLAAWVAWDTSCRGQCLILGQSQRRET